MNRITLTEEQFLLWQKQEGFEQGFAAGLTTIVGDTVGTIEVYDPTGKLLGKYTKTTSWVMTKK